MDFITIILYSVYLMIPAYFANGSALVFGGGTPMDFGKYAWDGRRLIGDGCTWRGLIGGGLLGMIVGGILGFLADCGIASGLFNISASFFFIIKFRTFYSVFSISSNNSG